MSTEIKALKEHPRPASAAMEHFNKLNEWRRLEMEATPAAPWWRQGGAMAFQGPVGKFGTFPSALVS